MPTTLESLSRILGAALARIRIASGNADVIRETLAVLGWDVPPGVDLLTVDLPDPSEVIDKLLAIQGSTPDELADELLMAGRYAELLIATSNLLNRVEEFAEALPVVLAGAGDYAARTNIQAELPTRLVDFLLMSAVGDTAPAAFLLLNFLGVFRIVHYQTDPANFQVEHYRCVIVWHRVSDLLSDPQRVLIDEYGWGTPHFDARTLLLRLAAITNRLGVRNLLRDLPRALEERLRGQSLPQAVTDPSPQLLLRLIDHPLSALLAVDLSIHRLRETSQGAGDAGIELVPFVQGVLEQDFYLTGALFLRLQASLDLEPGVSLGVRPGRVEYRMGVFTGSPAQAQGSLAVSLHYRAVGGSLKLLSAPGGTHLEVAEVHGGVGVEYGAQGLPDPYLEGGLVDGRLSVTMAQADGFLTKVLGKEFTTDFSLLLRWSQQRGLRIAGAGSLEKVIPVHQSFGPIAVTQVRVALGGTQQGISAIVAASGSLAFGPVHAAVADIGVQAQLVFSKGNLGPVDLSIGFKPPRGLGVVVDAEVVTGGGFLFFDETAGQYAGVVELSLEEIQVKAIGLLDTKLPGGQPGYSFLLIISTEFTPIQLGFGFTLNGVGGLAGINRTMMLDALRAGLRTNVLNSVLFPQDPIRNAPQLISNLQTIFPPSEGRYVFGPMLKIGWGERGLIVADLGIILELPAPVRLAILGRITAVAPAEAEAVLVLHMDVLGTIDFGLKKLAIDATIHDSKIAGFTLLGDMALRLDWGAQPNFVLSVGGLHPQFAPPPGFPMLRRLTLALGSGSNPRFSLETYLAVTSNTVQFGANLDASISAGGFTVHGYLGFDALFVLSPFSFVVDMHAGVDVRYRGFHLLNVALQLRLAGPTPWSYNGTGTIHILGIGVSVHVQGSFGSGSPTPLPSVAVLPRLIGALTAPHSWTVQLPTDTAQAVSLRAPPSGDGIFAHPSGQLVVRQTLVPLATQISRFGSTTPADGTRFDITAAQLDTTVLALTAPVTDLFAPAQFSNLTDAQKLSAPPFEPFPSGMALGSPAVDSGGPGASLQGDYHTWIIEDRLLPARQADPYQLPADQLAALAGQSAGAQAAVGRTGNRRYLRPGMVRPIQTRPPSYVITRASDLAVRRDLLERPTSYYNARMMLRSHLAGTPQDADGLEVTPTWEADPSPLEPPPLPPPPPRPTGLGVYRFYPYLRRGLARALPTPEDPASPSSVQPTLQAQVIVRAQPSGQTATASMPVRLHGPGGVIGLDPRQVVRTEPVDGTTNLEPNYLAGIELDAADLAWAFTPAAATGGRLRPWLVLIVLAAGEYTEPANATTPLPRITVTKLAALPNHADAWAWTHLQVTGADGAIEDVLKADSGRVVCRLLCPRKLDPDTSYTAFLVPAYEAGRLAGLGENPATVATAIPAWPPADADRLDLPIYYRFRFSTASAGDFASLVRQLQPVSQLPPEVGTRPIDVSHPAPAPFPPAGVTLRFFGALRALTTPDQDTDWQDPDKDRFQTAMQQLVNHPTRAVDDPDHPLPDDPQIGPPLYGRWLAAVDTVERTAPGWVTTLNLDPRDRAVAGMGVQVVDQQRQALLVSAWQQADGIDTANQRLQHARLAQAAMTAAHDNHLQAASQELLVSLTAPLHPQLVAAHPAAPAPTGAVAEEPGLTVRGRLATSPAPVRAVSAPFRRMSQPRSPLRQRQDASDLPAGQLLGRLNDGAITTSPPPHPPGGMASIDEVSDQFDPPWLPPGLRGWLRWGVGLLLALATLLIAVAALLSLLPAAAGLAAALVAAAAWLRTRLADLRITTGLRFADLTSGAIRSDPPNSRFTLADPGQFPPDQPGNSDSPDAAAFREAAAALGETLGQPVTVPPPPDPADLGQLGGAVQARLDPAVTLPARMGHLIVADPRIQRPVDAGLDPILAAPLFPQPMYEALREVGQEFLLPGVEHVPPDTLGLVETNQRFVEAYMVGLNHEIGRQLRWAGYPSGHRDTCFRQFWDVRAYVPGPDDPTDPAALADRLADIPPIAAWPVDSPLGGHQQRADRQPGQLVLLVRGQLLQRYPNTVISACKASWAPDGHTRTVATGEAAAERFPLFRATLTPDLTFLGFALTEGQARGGDPASGDGGWFFAFQQPPGEQRFGLEPSTADPLRSWAELGWGNFAFPTTEGVVFATPTVNPDHVALDNDPDKAAHWGVDAAQTAYITCRRPARLLVHATALLPQEPAA